MAFRTTHLFPLAALVALGACAHDPRRYALRPVVTRDQDLDNVALDCKGKDAKKAPCIATYESSFAWDGADNIIFRPVSEGLILKPRGEARDVNAFDEVPDSSWFTNRIGAHGMTDQEVEDGYCKPGKTLDAKGAKEGAWLIDHGKDNGANPGFRVNVDGVKYMLKMDFTDDHQGERGTAATAIATRFYWAAGWFTSCDSIVWFKRSILKLKDGLTIMGNVGKPKKFDEKLLDKMLEKTVHRGDLLHAAASRWVPGIPVGPFRYQSTRDDDPSDTVPHEHRRELRGARIIAAWLNHFDTREQNSMDTWMPENMSEIADGHKDPPPINKGYLRHWYIDLGDCFGSEWTSAEISKRLGYAYVLDWEYMGKDFITLGIPERPWDHNAHTPEAPIFGYFNVEDFEADKWRGEYPNPAFSNMTEGDGAWAARIIARFTPSQIQAAVRAGDFSEPAYSAFLVKTLLGRQRKIEARYFSILSPITDVKTTGNQICATDLARSTDTWKGEYFHYAASIVRGHERDRKPLGGIDVQDEGKLCVNVPSTQPDGGKPDNDADRYVVVQIANGIAKTPLELHLYDLGPKKGMQLVGIERRDD